MKIESWRTIAKMNAIRQLGLMVDQTLMGCFLSIFFELKC